MAARRIDRSAVDGRRPWNVGIPGHGAPAELAHEAGVGPLGSAADPITQYSRDRQGLPHGRASRSGCSMSFLTVTWPMRSLAWWIPGDGLEEACHPPGGSRPGSSWKAAEVMAAHRNPPYRNTACSPDHRLSAGRRASQSRSITFTCRSGQPGCLGFSSPQPGRPRLRFGAGFSRPSMAP